jgi:succinate dehydrogenase/fumarate reductase flavoprotein subunit
LDHQWNYPWGIRDPQRPGSGRGLTVEMWDGIWVNDKGQRFVNEILNPRDALAAVLTQLGQSYWGVMDNIGKSSFYVRGTGWDNPAKVDRLILDNSEITRKANSLRELAKIMGLPVGNFEQTISRWNEMVQRGADLDFGRFGPRRPDPLLLVSWANAKSRPLEQPPFYAVRMYPIARKSLGGLRIDHHCRVLNDASAAIPGLYAIGEVTGFGGVNGSAGLEGTFIGPSLLQGRIVGELLSAGRSIVAPQNWKPVERVSRSVGCTNCHSVQRLAEEKRRGFEHSALVHTVVKARSFACETCHGEMVPYEAKVHRIDRSTQSQTCAVCHLARE